MRHVFDVTGDGVDLKTYAPLVQAIRRAADAFTGLSVDRIMEGANAQRSRLLAELRKRPPDEPYDERRFGLETTVTVIIDEIEPDFRLAPPEAVVFMLKGGRSTYVSDRPMETWPGRLARTDVFVELIDQKVMRPTTLGMSLDDLVHHELLHAYRSGRCGDVRTNDVGLAAVRAAAHMAQDRVVYFRPDLGSGQVRFRRWRLPMACHGQRWLGVLLLLIGSGSACANAHLQNGGSDSGTNTDTSRAVDAYFGVDASPICLVDSSNYDQSCSADSDCVRADFGNYCQWLCRCGEDAINRASLARFNADVAMTPLGQGRVPGVCSCGYIVDPCCRGGQCITGSACTMDASIDLAGG